MKKIIKRVKIRITLFIKKVVRFIRKYNIKYALKARYYNITHKNNIIDVKSIERINLFGKIEGDSFFYDNDFSKIEEITPSSINIANFTGKDIDKDNIYFYGNKNHELTIFKDSNNKKIAYISFEPKKDFNRGIKKLKTLIVASQRLKAFFTIVYIKNHNGLREWCQYKNISKMLGICGADYIVFTSKRNDISSHQIKLFRNDKFTYVTKSLGEFIDSSKNGTMIHIEINPNNKNELREYYVPIKLAKKKIEYTNDKQLISDYNLAFENLKEKSDMLTLKDILDVIEIELPAKYKYLGNTSINHVCSRFSQVKGKDLLFLLEPYKYKNDTTTATDADRVLQARRAISRGCIFVISYNKLPKDIPHIVCKDTREAHIKLCSIFQSQKDIFTIGITGSVGKTTTKEMLASVFSTKYNVLKSIKNANLQVKMGRFIQKIQPNTEIYIQEIGGGRPGGASRHSRMIHPNMVMITNIGTAHLGNFDSQHDLMLNKLGILDGLKEGGIFFQNIDDDNLKNAEIKNCKVITYSAKNSNADYYATNIIDDGEKIHFTLCKKNSKDKIDVDMNVHGEHNVLNAVVCYAMADNYGISKKQVKEGLESFKTVGIRQNLMSIAGVNIFVDCYNASLDSVKTSLNSFNNIKVTNQNKKIIVIGDITGVGDETVNIHHAIANEIKKYKFDKIFLFGDMVKVTYDDLKKDGIECDYIKLSDSSKLTELLRKTINTGDAVLLKGSSKTLLEYQVDLLYGTNLSETRFIDDLEYSTIKSSSFEYHVFNYYASIFRYKGNAKTIKIPKTIHNKKIRGVFRDSFRENTNINHVILSDNIVYIGKSAFRNCKKLQSIDLKSVKFIDNNAFRCCFQLKELKLNSGVLHIGRNAFKYCTRLEKIYIPDSVKQIDETAFENSEIVTIVCNKDSYAYEYANKMGIKVLINK